MSAPTYNDQTFVESLSVKKKAKLMYRYLVMGDNMDEAGKDSALEGQSASMTTSAVMRVYGFEGRNSGILMGYGITYDDILAAVKHFPHGCDWDGGVAFKAYVCERVKKHTQSVSPTKKEVERGIKVESIPVKGEAREITSWNFLAFILGVIGFFVTLKIFTIINIPVFWEILLGLPVWFIITLVLCKLVIVLFRRSKNG